MRHDAARSLKVPAISVAWRKAEHAALRVNAADTCDDRVSDDIFDIEDERAAVDFLSHGNIRYAN